jgi:hypothetical protein
MSVMSFPVWHGWARELESCPSRLRTTPYSLGSRRLHSASASCTWAFQGSGVTPTLGALKPRSNFRTPGRGEKGRIPQCLIKRQCPEVPLKTSDVSSILAVHSDP